MSALNLYIYSLFLSLQVLPDLYLGNFRGVIRAFFLELLLSCSCIWQHITVIFLHGVVCSRQTQETESSWPETTSRTSSPFMTARPPSSRWEALRLLRSNTFAPLCISNFSLIIKQGDPANQVKLIRLAETPLIRTWHDLTQFVNQSVRLFRRKWQAASQQQTAISPRENEQWGGKFLLHVIVGVAWKKCQSITVVIGQCADLHACVGLRVGVCSCFSHCGLCSPASLLLLLLLF